MKFVGVVQKVKKALIGSEAQRKPVLDFSLFLTILLLSLSLFFFFFQMSDSLRLLRTSSASFTRKSF
jgi:hypothetical protein